VNDPARGEIWFVDLDPAHPLEQAGKRPCLVVSDDKFNTGKSRLVMVLPLTTKDRRIPFHIAIEPPEGGLKTVSYIMCDQLRTINKNRLVHRFGLINPHTIMEVEDRLRVLLGL
jgi:mRNA interferase MazF